MHITPRSTAHADALDAAGAVITCVPSLRSIVRCRVGSIGILRVDDDAYDVGHSEPAWPTTIFVSVPPPTALGSLRLAESIVHEAMHLHVTALEQSSPLVETEGVLFSPWRKEARSTAGVLHGLYVFSCIRAFLQIVIQEKWPSGAQRSHIQKRIEEINLDTRRVDIPALRGGLNHEGLLFLNAFR